MKTLKNQQKLINLKNNGDKNKMNNQYIKALTILSLQKSGHAVWIYPRKKTVSVDGFKIFKITDKELDKIK